MVEVLVLGGGDSPEREVSLRSAGAVAEAARQAGLAVQEADPAHHNLAFLDNLAKETIVLPILHGRGGEDGVIQTELEKRGLAFLGSDSVSSKNCFDKWSTRQILEKGHIPMPKGFLVTKGDYSSHTLAARPHVLKIRHGGSSIGTLIVRDLDTIVDAEIAKIFALEKEAILEELIEGTEVNVSILGEDVLPVIEIVPPSGGEFDYENKYNGLTAEICPPKSVNEDTQRKAQKISKQVHDIMGCRHLSRTDIMLDKDSNLFVLEINTIPGMTDQSLYPKTAAAAGLPMVKLVDRFIKMVKRDYRL